MIIQKTAPGQTCFHQMPWKWMYCSTHSAVCFHYPLALTNRDKVCGSILKVIAFAVCCLHPSGSPLCAPLLGAPVGCTFSYPVTDQVHWSVQRTCHGFEREPVSVLLQSQKLPTFPEVMVASGKLRLLASVVIPSLALWFFSMTSPLDPNADQADKTTARWG